APERAGRPHEPDRPPAPAAGRELGAAPGPPPALEREARHHRPLAGQRPQRPHLRGVDGARPPVRGQLEPGAGPGDPPAHCADGPGRPRGAMTETPVTAPVSPAPWSFVACGP